MDPGVFLVTVTRWPDRDEQSDVLWVPSCTRWGAKEVIRGGKWCDGTPQCSLRHGGTGEGPVWERPDASCTADIWLVIAAETRMHLLTFWEMLESPAASHVIQSSACWRVLQGNSLLILVYFMLHLVGSMQYWLSIQEQVNMWYWTQPMMMHQWSSHGTVSSLIGTEPMLELSVPLELLLLWPVMSLQ